VDKKSLKEDFLDLLVEILKN